MGQWGKHVGDSVTVAWHEGWWELTCSCAGGRVLTMTIMGLGRIGEAMRFVHYDLGQRLRGERIEVNLSGSAAHIRLLESSQLSAYRAGRRFRDYGGLATKSPARLIVPHAGHWHIAVDLAGLSGTVRSSVRML